MNYLHMVHRWEGFIEESTSTAANDDLKWFAEKFSLEFKGLKINEKIIEKGYA